MKIIDLLRSSTQKKPDSAAVKSESIELTYHRLLSDADYLAGFLNGCRPGVKTAIVLGNCAEYFTAFFAICAAGGTIVPLSARMTTYEISRFVERSDISIAITARLYGQRLLEWLDAQISIVSIEYNSDGRLQVETLRSGSFKVDNENTDLALMVYTSGTTGQRKIVMLTDDQLISNMFIYKFLMGFDEHNVVYCSLLFHHIYCICAQLLTHISLADTFVVYDRPFFIKDFLKAVETHKVTVSAFVPYMAILMAEFPQPEKFNLQSLRYITLSGAKTPKTVYQRLTKRFRHIQFINTYGMSEAGSRISIAAPEPNKFPVESVGTPMPGIKVRITDENGRTLPPDSVGEIQVKSSGVMKGYYKQPELTLQTIKNGWLKTGDLGKLDQDGNLFLVGRKKEIIISGGTNIYPVEIEECLMEHASVLEAAVVGKPDRRLQEVPCAFIVKKSDARISIPELIYFCKRHLSSYKIPASFYFVKGIPRLGTSKIDRRRLKKLANKRFKVQL